MREPSEDAASRRPLLRVEDVARRLNVSVDTVRVWLRRGRLQGIRLGGEKTGWRVSEASLAAFLAAASGKSTPRGDSRREQS